MPEDQNEQVLLLSCYEIGHQPLSLALPLAALTRAGIPANAYDLSIQPFPQREASQAALIAISVPMHTALRLGVDAARQARDLNPGAHICFYGLYAHLNRDYLLDSIADSVLAGESESALVDLADAIVKGSQVETPSSPILERLDFQVPIRDTLPELSQYAHYIQGNRHTTAGYTEASRGCLHTCNHCPVVPVYGGRFFIIPQDTVLADIRQQFIAGARHITFGDPDFLNGPKHALKIARAMRAEFPLTWDFTAKVEHILEHRHLFAEFAELGCTYVVSAFEAVNPHILERLDKGHTPTQMEEALHILRDAGISPQPTWMPFTPWTSAQDYLDLLAWIRDHSLIPYVPAVQLAVRMLVPPGSALLDHPDVAEWCGELDAANFSYRWSHPDPRMDTLQQEVMRIAEFIQEGDPYWAFQRIESTARDMLGAPPIEWTFPSYSVEVPRLTEHWFC